MNQNKGGTEERILEAAVQLFSRQGFSRTSTRELARLADVNEASIFRYFPRKQDLFFAALQSRLERIRLRKELQQGLSQAGRPELVVPLIVELLVHTAVYQPELIQLFHVGLLELPSGTERLYRQHVLPIFRAIQDYFQAGIASGSLRDLDSSMITVAFAATVLGHRVLYPLFAEAENPHANADEAISALTRFWLDALMPGAATGVRRLAPAQVLNGSDQPASLRIATDSAAQKNPRTEL